MAIVEQLLQARSLARARRQLLAAPALDLNIVGAREALFAGAVRRFLEEGGPLLEILKLDQNICRGDDRLPDELPVSGI